MAAAIVLITFSVLIFGLLFFWLKTILDIANTTFADTLLKAVWIGFVFFFPLVGICCWYLFGRQNMNGRPLV